MRCSAGTPLLALMRYRKVMGLTAPTICTTLESERGKGGLRREGVEVAPRLFATSLNALAVVLLIPYSQMLSGTQSVVRLLDWCLTPPQRVGRAGVRGHCG